MLARHVIPLPEHIYPADEWRIVESRFDPRHMARAETIFAQSNGFVGLRATPEEGRPSLSPGTFVSGFHETWPIKHAEEAYGLARTGQTIVNVPDATVFKLYVDDEPLVLPFAHLAEYGRVLDMRAGELTRELIWSTPGGKRVRVRSSRMVSFRDRHLVVMDYEVTLLDGTAPVTIVSKVLNRQDTVPEDEPAPGAVDPRLARQFPERVLRCKVARTVDHRILLGYRTSRSGMMLGLGVDHVIRTRASHRVEVEADGDMSRLVLTAEPAPGEPIRITKYATYQSSTVVPAPELADRCARTLDRAVRQGLDHHREAQRGELDRFWDRADIRISNGPETARTRQAIRWNLFQLAQATWRAEGAGVPAKGLTGQAYEGHYFWDTEIYVLPFLAYTHPRIARNLLRFRHSMLDRARERAREMRQRGALFPWRTINGDEASAYYQAGTAQYHINADIAYAVLRYVEIRDDPEFMARWGAELLVETARMWANLGFYGEGGDFHIHGVTGPDEYTTVVNDNAFTNLMARRNLKAAVGVVREMAAGDPASFHALVDATDLLWDETEVWEKAAEAMFIPFDKKRGILPQDAGFLDRERWDLTATPRELFPLLLHFHPLTIYRYQVIKQADVVLALFLLGEEFSLDEKRRNFQYYDPLTTGDSSLSAAVQSIVAAEIGDAAKAMEYFEYALMMDLGDVAGNVSDGVHVASTGGVWQALIFGFAGVRDREGHLEVNPALPAEWDELAFSLRFRDRQLRVHLGSDVERYLLEEGDSLEIRIRGKAYTLEVGEALEVAPR
ncbi:MAG: glycoside hydrolase family 65 protein [Gemmatimonadales bacterium]|nr:MAG: glycoside hydrolase family 65 protein [Gemmatimonadales bacterium]